MAGEHFRNPEFFDPVLFSLADDSQFSAELDNLFRGEISDGQGLKNRINYVNASCNPEVNIRSVHDLANAAATGLSNQPDTFEETDANQGTENIFTLDTDILGAASANFDFGGNEESAEPSSANLQNGPLDSELVDSDILTPRLAPSPLSRSQLPRNLRNRRRHRPKFSLQQINSLEEWLDCHRDYPYPDKEAKERLIRSTGLTEVQINRWFTNRRTRQPMQSSPLEAFLAAMEQAASKDDIQHACMDPQYQAINAGRDETGCPEIQKYVEPSQETAHKEWNPQLLEELCEVPQVDANVGQPGKRTLKDTEEEQATPHNEQIMRLTSPKSPLWRSGIDSETFPKFPSPLNLSSGQQKHGRFLTPKPPSLHYASPLGQKIDFPLVPSTGPFKAQPLPLPAAPSANHSTRYAKSMSSAESASSAFSPHSNAIRSRSPRRGRRKFNPPSLTKAVIVRETDDSSPRFYCTFCRQPYTSKTWKRHEETQHLPHLRAKWTCMPNGVLDAFRFSSDVVICTFCNYTNPVDTHPEVCSRIAECLETDFKERTFERRDHLTQHLKNVHNALLPKETILEWKTEAPPSDQEWTCGFCGAILTDWDTRASHIAKHFRAGLDMSKWDSNRKTQIVVDGEEPQVSHLYRPADFDYPKSSGDTPVEPFSSHSPARSISPARPLSFAPPSASTPISHRLAPPPLKCGGTYEPIPVECSRRGSIRLMMPVLYPGPSKKGNDKRERNAGAYLPLLDRGKMREERDDDLKRQHRYPNKQLEFYQLERDFSVMAISRNTERPIRTSFSRPTESETNTGRMTSGRFVSPPLSNPSTKRKPAKPASSGTCASLEVSSWSPALVTLTARSIPK